MRLFRNLLFAFVTSVSALATAVPAEATPGHSPAHRTVYLVYWRLDAYSPWVRYPATYSCYQAASNARAHLTNTYRVQTFLRRLSR